MAIADALVVAVRAVLGVRFRCAAGEVAARHVQARLAHEHRPWLLVVRGHEAVVHVIERVHTSFALVAVECMWAAPLAASRGLGLGIG